MAEISSLHTPVLVQRCLELLAPALAAPDAVLIDATLGMGGHTEAALRQFPQLTVIGIDRDPQAIALAEERLAAFGTRFQTVHTTYDRIREVAAQFGTDGLVDGVLMDLGVSSLQLDSAERGFSYARPAALDMRMDQSCGQTAQDILDTASGSDLTRILRTYGEERFASRIAAALVRRREAGHPVQDTAALAELVRESIPAAARRSGGHPAKRTFQALRIAVNSELEVLTAAIPNALDSLRLGGRMVVESYQSLEDRIVKQAFVSGSTVSTPADMPFIPQMDQPYLELLVRGAGRADEEEQARNPRSAPVRLRAVKRIRAASEAPAHTRPNRHKSTQPARRRNR